MPRRSLATGLAVVALAAGLTACSSSKKWCEHDATDTKVSDSYCKRGVPGYEWETDSSHKKSKKVKKPKSSSSKRK